MNPVKALENLATKSVAHESALIIFALSMWANYHRLARM
jgi:hypothetical protein